MASTYVESYWKRNPDAENKLTELWLKGYSAPHILVELGAEKELTRNAIIGKAHRMGLPHHERGRNSQIIEHIKNRHKPGRPTLVAKRRRKRATIVQPPPMPVTPLTDLKAETCHTAVTLYDAQPHQCRWPVGHLLFCGATIKPDSRFSFCPTHYKRATTYSYKEPHYAKYSNFRAR